MLLQLATVPLIFMSIGIEDSHGRRRIFVHIHKSVILFRSSCGTALVQRSYPEYTTVITK